MYEEVAFPTLIRDSTRIVSRLIAIIMVNIIMCLATSLQTMKLGNFTHLCLLHKLISGAHLLVKRGFQLKPMQPPCICHCQWHGMFF